jgi:hypothetical protein
MFSGAIYLGTQKRCEQKHPKDVSWFIVKRSDSWNKLDSDRVKAEEIKSVFVSKWNIRADKLNWPKVLKRSAIRYRSPDKNTNRLH